MQVRLVYNHWLPKILRIGAITLYPFVLISSRSIVTGQRLIKHEMAHVEQVRRDGWLYFYVRYLWEYARNLVYLRSHSDAYLQISYETQARAVEHLALTADEKREAGLA